MSLLSRLLHRSAPVEHNWIEAEALMEQLATARAPLVIDVRDQDEFTGPLGYIEDAMNLPMSELPAHLSELAKEDRPLVLVCKSDRRSAAAAAQLRAAGATDVAVLRGGMERWRMLNPSQAPS